jgi:ubiquinone/menaquinone biosynthesis C-methylase UbiE
MKMPKRIAAKVVDHFDGAAAMYSHRKGIVHAEADPSILAYIHGHGPGKILEVGGGSGYLLDMLAEDAGKNRLVNCELAWQTYRQQVNPRISLIGGDALHLPFEDNAFDYVIIKNILHHLVGGSRRASRKNTIQAATELERVSRNGAALFVVEQFHQCRICADVLFYLSLIFSLARIQVVSFGIRRDIIVSFLTPKDIRSLFNNPSTQETFLDRQIHLAPPFPLRIVPYFNRFGRLFLAKSIHK